MKWLLLACCLLPGIASAASLVTTPNGTFRLHVTSLKARRYLTTVHQQYDFSCGSAAVATLLTYQYGYPVDEQTVFQEMYAHGNRAKIRAQGFSLLDIKRYLALNGFDADGFRVPLTKLKQQHLPAIVLIDEHGYHHFVVIKGLRDGRVLIGDPAKGTRSMPRSQFLAMWQNHLVFVIHNRRALAVFNSPRDWNMSPVAPLGSGVNRRGLDTQVMPKGGTGVSPMP